MKMLISKQMQERIREQVTLSPLAVGDMRRIEGLGEYYATLNESEVDESQYRVLYDMTIDGIVYKIATKRSNGG